MAGGRGWAGLAAMALVSACALASCGKAPREPRPAWRDEAERACLRSGVVKESPYVVRGPAIDGPGACGALSPFHVSAFSNGEVALTTPSGHGQRAYAATLTCTMVPVVDRWVSAAVQSAAAAVYGQPVVEIHSLGSYSCRRMNNGTNTTHISEHAFADAIDVSGFRLADGRDIMVKTGWRGSPEEQEFLRAVFVGSCESFGTVLGPGSDGHHEDHFHLDLMRHSHSLHICRPVIKFTPRTAAPLAAPVRPPVPPQQLQPEPESDDPYAFDDTKPDLNPATAVAMGAAASPLRAPEPRRPAPAERERPAVQVAAASPAPLRRLEASSGASAAPPVEVEAAARGDRLDRLGAGGSSIVAKDDSRLGGSGTGDVQRRPILPPRRPATEEEAASPAPAYAPAGRQVSALAPNPLPPGRIPARASGETLPPGWIASPPARPPAPRRIVPDEDDGELN